MTDQPKRQSTTPSRREARAGARAVTAQIAAGKGQRPGVDLGRDLEVPFADRHGAGLCLSGGGFRAALFHLGACRRLDELGILGTLRTVSGASGGAIVANLLEHPDLRWPHEHPELTRVGGLEELVAAPLRELASHNIRTPAILSRLLPTRWFVLDGGVRALADQLAKHIPWWSTPLRDIGIGGPGSVTGATEIGYGIDWRFYDPTSMQPQGWLGDYRLGFAPPPPAWRIADSVATSCAFPPVFAPRRLDGASLGLSGGTPGLESSAAREDVLRTIELSDGGVYDQLALEPVWKDHRTVLVSDGGAVFRARTTYTPFGRALRILNIATDGGTSVRVRWLHASMAAHEVEGATWALDTVVPQGYPPAVAEMIGRVRTDLDSFSEGERAIVERHGYLVAEQSIREHAPHLVVHDAPLAPPFDEWADPAKALRVLQSSARRTLWGRW
ncbi:patatin-like phospholipase family protein [Arsenicicoccus piscis]|uniref:patatin-like phospholipase family protein n=1 Tax=Arsenicicoccus piscis TaxID=673954 RepID=UPI001F4D0647|nr:patatin-like phospholipase family protein [Arsenicicoccus piscis]